MDETGSTPLETTNDASALPVIRGYKVRRVINHGGMATVYLAQQIAPPRDVAIKVLAEHTVADEVSRRRFENEVRTIARLEHPNIVQIHELGRTGGDAPYYSMQYLSRGHLGQRRFRREDGGVDEARVIEILRALLSALGYAHLRGIVHRDVKAENVLFDERDRPMLADFGIALRRGFGTRVTAIGLAVGTTAYMAPEQARGQEVDARADLYSVGVLAWEMLTGELPYRAADALSMAMQHTQSPIPKLPNELRHWQRFINMAMAKSPRARFDNVAAMTRELDVIERQPRWPRIALHRATPLLARARGFAGTRAGIATLTVAALALVVALLAGGGDGDGFFRATGMGADTARAGDPTDAMFEPLPESPVQPHIDAARAFIKQRNLTAPAEGNAYMSVLAAWQADHESPMVREVIGELSGAFGTELLQHLRTGNDARARDYLEHTTQLARDTGVSDTPQQVELRSKATEVLQARMDRAIKQIDRDDAQRIPALAADLLLPDPVVERLRARVAAIPRKGQTIPGDPAGSIVASGGIALSPYAVSRSEYARFASSTGRKSALCRERVSVLRLVKPRDWRAPGFAQTNDDPVVCVSPADADAYARWLSARSGNRYRLPSARESSQMAARLRGPVTALWLRECGASCTQRQATGARSVRSASRGYEDTGFRLVRDL